MKILSFKEWLKQQEIVAMNPGVDEDHEFHEHRTHGDKKIPLPSSPEPVKK